MFWFSVAKAGDASGLSCNCSLWHYIYLICELPPGEQVTIDKEYTGHEDNIKNTLLPLLWRTDPDFDAENGRRTSCAFRHVGKKSAAHKKALAVYHGKAEADTILKADDLLRQIIGR